jgi:hypothetical protein
MPEESIADPDNLRAPTVTPEYRYELYERAQRKQEAGFPPLHVVAVAFLYCGDELPIIRVMTMYDGLEMSPRYWKTLITEDGMGTAHKVLTYDAEDVAVQAHRIVVENLSERLAAADVPVLAVTETPPAPGNPHK